MEKPLGPKKILRAPALKRGREIIPITERVKLERVLGFTVSNNASFTCDPNSGIIAYPAGCVVVLQNLRKHRQSHISSSSKKTITSLAFSADGKYLATGECGHQPHVRVWDVQEKCQVAEFQGHKYGINCVAFSPNLKYVVSVGSQHDMIVNVWDWKNNVKVASNKVSCKVKAVSFASNGSYFVTVGNRHVKFWYLECSRTAKHKHEAVPLLGRSAILGDRRNDYFGDVACGKGNMVDSTYAITKSGLLCEFNSRRLLDKWVELRTTSANCISVGELFIFVGCASGIIRCFNPTDLNFICTLPKSHYLGIDVAKGVVGGVKPNPQNPGLRYPDAIGVSLDEVNRKVSCIYNDHSLYVWDIKDLKKIGKSQSFMYHSACIWGIETYPLVSEGEHSVLPRNSFLTCSSDDTIRFWNLEFNLPQDTAYHRNIYSSELLKILYIDSELIYLCDTDFNPSGSNDKVDTNYDGKNGVRCLRISPDGKQLASGDRSGNIRIHDLEFVDELCKVEAHDSEVLCLEYSRPVTVEGDQKRYLASASRDRLIHVFDVNEDYTFQQTLDDHSSSITAVRFVQNGDCLQMISCGADKSIIFRKALFNPQLSLVREHHVVGKTTLYDMEVDEHQHHILTACQDRNIRTYSVASGKQIRYFRGSQGEDGTLIKVVLDPTGTYLATSCTDKSLYLYDYLTGECLAAMFGHSELVTGLTFTHDGQHLISVSGDGCIFVWRLPIEVTQTMLSKRTGTCDGMAPGLWQMGRKSAVAVTKPIQAMEQHSEVGEKQLVNGNATGRMNIDGYRFSMGQLPLWAKKQMSDSVAAVNNEQKLTSAVPPRGRWAQRVDGQGVVVRSYLDSDSVIPYQDDADMKQSFNYAGNSEFPNETKTNCFGNNGNESFEICEESYRDILNQTHTEENNASNVTLRSLSNYQRSQSGRERLPIRPLSEPNCQAAMRLEDMDAEDEYSDSEISEMVYYPISEDGSEPGDGSYHVCGSGEIDGKGHSQAIRGGRQNRLSSAMPIIGTPAETNSDEEDASTPVDSDKSFLSSLCISTENLERLGQRENFMRSNYESLEREETEDRAFYRHSISAKFLAGSRLTRPANGMQKQSQPDSKRLPTSTSKREELIKALNEAKKKLETVGFRSGLSSSKSIGDLHNMPEKDSYQRSKSATPAGDIRRAASMFDLTGSSVPVKPVLSSPSPAPKKNSQSSAPLWDQSNAGFCDNSSPKTNAFSKLHEGRGDQSASPHFVSRSISMSSLHVRRSLTPCSAYKLKKISPLLRNPELVTNKATYVSPLRRRNNNLPSLPLRNQGAVVVTPATLATDSSSDSSAPEADSNPFSFRHPVRPRFPSTGEAGLEPRPLYSKSQSEWNLKDAGNVAGTPRRCPGKMTGYRNSPLKSESCSHIPQFCTDTQFLGFDPASVPLTQELCRNLSESLKWISSYAMQVYQRVKADPELPFEEKFRMSNMLAQSVWQAQQTLRPPADASTSQHAAPRLLQQELDLPGHLQNGDMLQKNSDSQPEVIDTMALLQQFSDKLLNIVEQQIGGKGSEDRSK